MAMENKLEKIGQNSFIKPFLKLSIRRVDNPVFCFRGHIIEHYYRSKTLKLVTGMRKKQ